MISIRIDGSVSFRLPDNCFMTELERLKIERQVQSFIHWELNEFVRLKTGVVNYYGPCGMEERANEYKKES